MTTPATRKAKVAAGPDDAGVADGACAHCGDSLAGLRIVRREVRGAPRLYCCHGCAFIAEQLELAEHASADVAHLANEPAPGALPDARATIPVQGMVCAACGLLIEHRLHTARLLPARLVARQPLGELEHVLHAHAARAERTRALLEQRLHRRIVHIDAVLVLHIDAHEAKICGVEKANREHFVDHVVTAVKVRKGGIVLMHEIHPNTLAQLDTLIERLLAEGFRFAPLTDPAFQPSLH